jgi:RNA polymerase sigma factor (sigma-70 family)
MPKPGITKTISKQVDADWDAYQADTTNSALESKLYETLLKMANAEARRRFKTQNEDAACQAMIRLIEALKSNAYAKSDRARFSTWAQRVVNNAVMDEFKAELVRRKVEIDGADWRLKDTLADPGVKVELQERLHALDASKELLSPRQRQVVEGLLAGKSEQDIANELGLSKQAVSSYWKKALRKVEDGR